MVRGATEGGVGGVGQNQSPENQNPQQGTQRGTSNAGFGVTSGGTPRAAISAGSLTKIGRAFQELKTSYTRWKDNYCSPLTTYLQKAEKKKIGKMLGKDVLTAQDVTTLMGCKYEGKDDFKQILTSKQAGAHFVILDTFEKIKTTTNKKARSELCKKLRLTLIDSANKDLVDKLMRGLPSPQKNAKPDQIIGLLSLPPNHNDNLFSQIVMPLLESFNKTVLTSTTEILTRDDGDVEKALWKKYDTFIPRTEVYLKRAEGEKIGQILAKEELESQDVEALMGCKIEGRGQLGVALMATRSQESDGFPEKCFDFLEKLEQFKIAKKPEDRKRLFGEIQGIMKTNENAFFSRIGIPREEYGRLTQSYDQIFFTDKYFKKEGSEVLNLFNVLSANVNKYIADTLNDNPDLKAPLLKQYSKFIPRSEIPSSGIPGLEVE